MIFNRFSASKPRSSSVLAIIALTVTALTMPLTAHAESMSYIFSGIGTGTLGGNAFTDQAFSLTFVGDTANVTKINSGNGIYRLSTFSSTAFTIGTTNATLTSLNGGAYLFANTNNARLGISNQNENDFLGYIDSRIYSYNLASSFGPASLSNNYAANAGDSSITLSTSAGALKFTSVQTNAGAFKSGEPSTTVPEPASVALIGLAMPLFGMVVAARRRKK